MIMMILAYVLIVVFLGIERCMRKTDDAKSLSRGSFDRGSTFLIAAAFAVAILVAPLLDYLQLGVVGYATAVGSAGISMMIFGLLIRVWAARTLGEFYTRTLTVDEKQYVVERGPYRFVRHPGYVGIILLWTGFSQLDSYDNDSRFHVHSLCLSHQKGRGYARSSIWREIQRVHCPHTKTHSICLLSMGREVLRPNWVWVPGFQTC